MRSSTSQEPSNVISIWASAPNLSKCYEHSVAQLLHHAWCGIQPLSCNEHFKVRKLSLDTLRASSRQRKAYCYCRKQPPQQRQQQQQQQRLLPTSTMSDMPRPHVGREREREKERAREGGRKGEGRGGEGRGGRGGRGGREGLTGLTSVLLAIISLIDEDAPLRLMSLPCCMPGAPGHKQQKSWSTKRMGAHGSAGVSNTPQQARRLWTPSQARFPSAAKAFRTPRSEFQARHGLEQ